MNADIFAIQETKMQEGQADISKEGYFHYMNSAIKKGYSGTLIYTKKERFSPFFFCFYLYFNPLTDVQIL